MAGIDKNLLPIALGLALTLLAAAPLAGAFALEEAKRPAERAARPAGIEQVDGSPGEGVACASVTDIWAYANAADQHDAARMMRLLNGRCEHLAGRSFEVVKDDNGMLKIRVFNRPNDWATSKEAYTLDDFVTRSGAE
jgi:hypothetical protein